MSVDLHIHSNYSDGSLKPEEIVDVALELGLSAIAITDHDNVMAHKLAQAHAEKRIAELNKSKIEIIPGIEVNTIWKEYEVHILGYYMDSSNKCFQELLAYQQHARLDQTVKIIEKLKQVGINLKLENITSLVIPGGSIGRPHIARAITSIGGTKNTLEAYSKYINDSAPTYIKRKTVLPHEAVETIYEAGGIPVIAHPGDIDVIEDLVKELMSVGLRGIEAYHRRNSPAMVEYFSSMAEKFGLIVTGGSDCHGPKTNKQLLLGKNLVPAWILNELKNEKNRLEIASG